MAARDKIAFHALEKIQSKVISPVIFEVRPGTLNPMVDMLLPYTMDAQPHLLSRPTPTSGIFKRIRAHTDFNYINTVLKREHIFDFAQDPNVIRVYDDAQVFAISLPNVTKENIFTVNMLRPRPRSEELTSTYYTRKLLGIDKTSYTGKNVKVAVLDTGDSRINTQNSIVYHESVIAEQRDTVGHGTWVTTCIGGNLVYARDASRQTKEHIPMLGMAPDSIIYSIECMGWYVGVGSTSDLIEGIGRAISNNAKIVNMSLGSTPQADTLADDPMTKVCKTAREKGMIIVAAAGNSGPSPMTIDSPGISPDVLTVGAYDELTGKLTNFSGVGPTKYGDTKPDCIAPGVNIISSSAGVLARGSPGLDQTAILTGTSMATPHIAGLLTVMEEAHNKVIGHSLRLEEVLKILSIYGSQPKSNLYGYGVLDYPMYQKYMNTEYGVNV